MIEKNRMLNYNVIVGMMNRRIDEIYGDRRKDLYQELLATTQSPLNEKIVQFCNSNMIRIIISDLESERNINPCLEIQFKLSPFKKPGYYIEYETVLQTSKLCRVIHLRNRFKLKDENPDAANRFLEGEGHANGPITNTQENLCDLLLDFYSQDSYMLMSNLIGCINVAGLTFSPMSCLYDPQNPIAFATYYDVFFRCKYDDLVCIDYYYELHKRKLRL